MWKYWKCLRNIILLAHAVMHELRYMKGFVKPDTWTLYFNVAFRLMSCASAWSKTPLCQSIRAIMRQNRKLANKILWESNATPDHFSSIRTLLLQVALMLMVMVGLWLLFTIETYLWWNNYAEALYVLIEA